MKKTSNHSTLTTSLKTKKKTKQQKAFGEFFFERRYCDNCTAPKSIDRDLGDVCKVTDMVVGKECSVSIFGSILTSITLNKSTIEKELNYSFKKCPHKNALLLSLKLHML